MQIGHSFHIPAPPPDRDVVESTFELTTDDEAGGRTTKKVSLTETTRFVRHSACSAVELDEGMTEIVDDSLQSVKGTLVEFDVRDKDDDDNETVTPGESFTSADTVAPAPRGAVTPGEQVELS